ncbi:MAG: hypothetical protein ING19_12085, partial [Azospirillum sp.]|nr:hypothetical protein [Azospirillum sp.]
MNRRRNVAFDFRCDGFARHGVLVGDVVASASFRNRRRFVGKFAAWRSSPHRLEKILLWARRRPDAGCRWGGGHGRKWSGRGCDDAIGCPTPIGRTRIYGIRSGDEMIPNRLDRGENERRPLGQSGKTRADALLRPMDDAGMGRDAIEIGFRRLHPNPIVGIGEKCGIVHRRRFLRRHADRIRFAPGFRGLTAETATHEVVAENEQIVGHLANASPQKGVDEQKAHARHRTNFEMASSRSANLSRGCFARLAESDASVSAGDDAGAGAGRADTGFAGTDCAGAGRAGAGAAAGTGFEAISMSMPAERSGFASTKSAN